MIDKLTLYDFDVIEMDGRIAGIEMHPKSMEKAIETLMDKINEIVDEVNTLKDRNDVQNGLIYRLESSINDLKQKGV
jgi:peptidoglycan hydrolase CwlO-like protein